MKTPESLKSLRFRQTSRRRPEQKPMNMAVPVVLYRKGTGGIGIHVNMAAVTMIRTVQVRALMARDTAAGGPISFPGTSIIKRLVKPWAWGMRI